MTCRIRPWRTALISHAYREPKRAVDDNELGPLVGTQMTRCISCTRCVRFTTEVAASRKWARQAGERTLKSPPTSKRRSDVELQGNVIDLCPVGALTIKPYAFDARPWELKKTESIDVMDALGSNIRVDVARARSDAHSAAQP